MRDTSGAVVAGATVSAARFKSSATFSTVTNPDGLFRLPLLPVGRYAILVRRPGFSDLLLKDVSITVGSKTHLGLVLQITVKVETVTVTSPPPNIEITRSQVSSTIDERMVNQLPLNGRSFLEFGLLTPAVTRDARIGDFSFTGQHAMNLVVVDGADNNNAFFGLPRSQIATAGSSPNAQRNSYQFSLAAVQELQVNTNAYSAELGRAGAGLINVVTKSGTNDFHGSVFWCYRDKSMNANDAVNKLNGQPKQAFHFHQFGGVFGGPILRNKLWFFVNYEGQRGAIENRVFLSLPAGFAFSPDPVVAGYQRQALQYLAARAFPYSKTFSQNVVLGKLEWVVSSRHLLTSRWNRQRFFGDNLLTAGPQNSWDRTGPSVISSDSFTLMLTSSLSPSRFNVARFSYVQSDDSGRPNSINPELNVFEGGQLVLVAGRWVRAPSHQAIRQAEWSDTLAVSRGHHTLKAGADVLVDWIEISPSSSFSGSYRFSSLESFGRNLSGLPAPAAGDLYQQSFSADGRPVAVHPNIQELAVFIQDDWSLKPHLTLNLGLRYDLESVAQGTVRNPAPSLAAAGLDTSRIPQDRNNLAPRIGVAWSPLRNDRMVVRAGYGMFYARTPAIWTGRAQFANGITVQTREFLAGTPEAALIPLYPNNACGPPDPSGGPPGCVPPAAGAGNVAIATFSPQYVQPLVHQGSGGIEYQLGNDLSVSAAYLWVKGTHLQRTLDVNLATPTQATNIGIAGTATVLRLQRFVLPRPISGFDRVWLFESGGNSTYHGLVVQVNKRYSHDFQLLASYSLSKVTDDVPDYFTVNFGFDDFRMVADSTNPRADRAAGNNDQRHRVVVAGVWQLNSARHESKAAKAFLAGWELSGILSAQSGQPYSGLVSSDLNNDGNNATDRTPGLGRNTFYPGGSASFDLRIARNLSLTERMQLQFSWDAFNLFNSANIVRVRDIQYSRSTNAGTCGIAGTPCLVPQDAGLTAFGVPTVSSGPRIMQLSTKFVF